MQKIKVQKEDLKKALEANREIHAEEFDKAREAYKREAKARLEEAIEKIEHDGLVNLSHINELVAPVNYLKEYDAAILMAKMSNDHVIELANDEFRKYFMDEWSWRHRAIIANTTYTG